MRLIVGISGSIASYRSPDFVKDLIKLDHEVQVVLSPSAGEFVSEKVLETVSGKRVYGPDNFSAEKIGTDHIAVARWAEGFFVYGASAETLARFAQGSASDFLSLQLLAFRGPVRIAPAMNPSMWDHPAMQRNVKLLEGYGYQFVGPVAGVVLCGESGVGHIADHADMLQAVAQMTQIDADILALSASTTNGVNGPRVLISAGAMRSAVDPMRFIQNRSSGATALAVARAFRAAGCAVNVLLGPVSPLIEAAFRAEFEDLSRFESAADYESQLNAKFLDCDGFVSLAAVLDFTVEASDRKLARQDLKDSLTLAIDPVKDFVREVTARKRSGQWVVAFAAEVGTEDEILARARAKLEAKGCDIIVANPLSRDLGVDKEYSKFYVLSKHEPALTLGPATKTTLGPQLVRVLLERLQSPTPSPELDLTR